MKARIKATNEVAEILKAEQYASSGEYRFFWLDIDKPEPFNRFRPDEIELIDDITCGKDENKFTQQDVNDLRLLSDLAFDGACISDDMKKEYKEINIISELEKNCNGVMIYDDCPNFKPEKLHNFVNNQTFVRILTQEELDIYRNVIKCNRYK